MDGVLEGGEGSAGIGEGGGEEVVHDLLGAWNRRRVHTAMQMEVQMNNWRRVETLPLALSSQMVEVYMGQMAEEKPTAMPTQSEGGQMHTQEASHDGHVPVVLPADHEDGEDGGDETEDDERLEISESKGASRTILIPFSLAIQTERGEANMAKKRMMALKRP